MFEFAANNSLSTSTSFVSLFMSFHSYARLTVARWSVVVPFEDWRPETLLSYRNTKTVN